MPTSSDELVTVPLDRDVVVARGPESADYLHGQVSQDIASMAVGDSRWSFVLQPQGKVEALFRVTRTAADEFVLDVDAGWGPALTDSLARFKLRTKIEFEPRPWQVLRLLGTGAGEAAARATGTEVVVPIGWPGIEGVDLLGAAPAVEGVPVLGEGERDGSRIAAGIPVMGIDIDESTIPNETDLIDLTVDFAKGCYRGQELVERIHSRSGGRQLLRRLRVDGQVPVGAEIRGDDGPVGTVTSSSGADGGPGLALGYVRGAVEPGAGVVVAWDGGTARARIESLLAVS